MEAGSDNPASGAGPASGAAGVVAVRDDGLRAACLGDAGIANLSAWFVRDDLARGALVRVRLEDATPQPLSIWAVYASQRLLPPRTRVFVDALARRLRDWCAPDPAVSSPAG